MRAIFLLPVLVVGVVRILFTTYLHCSDCVIGALRS